MLKTILIAAISAAAAPATLAVAQEFPNAPVKLVVPYPAGGGTDASARLLANELSAIWGQPVVVENLAGGSGAVGTNAVAEASPDGYTLGYVIAAHATNPLLLANIPYSHDDFELVSLVLEYPYLMVASPDLPADTVGELIKHAKENPGVVAFAHTGMGGHTHLGFELLMQMAGVELLNIPYPGTAQANVALMSGESDIMLTSVLATMPLIEAGSMKILAVTSPERSGLLPDVEAAAEVMPGYSVMGWHGVIAPAGTPGAIVAKVQADIAQALQSDVLRTQFLAEDTKVVGGTPEKFQQYIDNDVAVWGAILEEIGLSAQ